MPETAVRTDTKSPISSTRNLTGQGPSIPEFDRSGYRIWRNETRTAAGGAKTAPAPSNNGEHAEASRTAREAEAARALSVEGKPFTVAILNRTLSQTEQRTFRSEGGVLQEQRRARDGTSVWVDASKNDHLGVGQRPVLDYHYANGYLYSKGGEQLGRFGIYTGRPGELGKSGYLNVEGALNRPGPGGRPEIRDFSWVTHEFGNNPNSPIVLIHLRPPPDAIPVLTGRAERTVLVDSGPNCYHEVKGDSGREIVWMSKDQAKSFVGAKQMTTDEVLAIPVAEDGYRYVDGTLRFKVVGGEKIVAEAR